MPRVLVRICLLLAWTLLPGNAAQAQQAATDAALRPLFIAAMAEVRATPSAPAAGDPEALQRYVLYPYLQASRLQRRLALATTGTPATDAALDAEIAAFLARRGNQPVARTLRSDWLARLAARKDWGTFLEHYSAERDTQATLRCHAFTARVALQRTDGLTDALRETWLTPKSLPDACDPAIAWWKTRGGPGEDLTEQRARLALAEGDAGLARFLARDLPATRAAPLLQWSALIESPAREVTALIAQPARPVEPRALQDGWQRLARADADAAIEQLPALLAARGLDARAAGPYLLAIALPLSWARDPRALEFFRRADVADYDERAFEWHVRAALWAGDWAEAASGIAAMPETLRSQPRWQYWAARSAEKQGEAARARTLYAAVLPTDNWYAVHAAARLDRKFEPKLEPLGLTDTGMAQVAAAEPFVRMRELLLCDMDADAAAEWKQAWEALAPAQQVQAVGVASRWGWHHQSIAAAARLKLFNDYDVLYPRPFDALVHDASRRTGLPDELIYAIIRQESLFRADAASSAGAVGLMQLLPETARLTARRAGLPSPMRAQLILPEVNIPLGAEFLASLVRKFDGETALAAAGYNAGPNAARRWLPPGPLDLDVWAENIPYNETRAYVQRVAWHALVFAWLAERKPSDVRPWLRSIRPSTTEAAEDAAR